MSLASDTSSLPSTDPLAATLIVGGVVIIAMMMMLATRRKMIARAGTSESPRERMEKIKAQAAGRDVTSQREAALVDLAQDLASRLDAKAARLETLLEESQQTIDHLQAALNDASTAAQSYAAFVPVIETSHTEPKLPAIPRDPLTASVYQLADGGHNSIEIAQQLDEQVGKVELILALRGGEA